MVHSCLCFHYRQPHLDPQEFRDHIVSDWLPVLKRALAPHHPTSLVVHFPVRAASGAGNRFAIPHLFKGKVPDDSLVVALGDPKDPDLQWDAVSEWRFKDELSLLQAAGQLHEGMSSGDLAEEEAKWCQTEKTKIVLLGESVELFPENSDNVAPRTTV